MRPFYYIRRWYRAGTRIDLDAVADMDVRHKMRVEAGIVGHDAQFQMDMTKRYGRRSAIRKSDQLMRKARRAEKRGDDKEAELLWELWRNLVAHECNWIDVVADQEKQGLRSSERTEKRNRLQLWLTIINLIILLFVGFKDQVMALLQFILTFNGIQ